LPKAAFKRKIPAMKSIRIAPSILAADFAHLAAQIEEAQRAGADWIHVDVMDGRFVPNISIGIPIVQAVRRVTDLPLDVHLMIVEPERHVQAFADAGADILTVHVEASPHLNRTVQQIHSLGLRAGVSLNPATSLSTLEEILPDVDLVLVMSVNPGFGGQHFLPPALPRLRRIRQMLDALGSEAELEVDGGIDARTTCEVVAAGATVLVAGSAIFGSALGVARAVQQIRQAANKTPDPPPDPALQS
jgi:ribulose-phosphate 3-epimerase